MVTPQQASAPPPPHRSSYHPQHHPHHHYHITTTDDTDDSHSHSLRFPHSPLHGPATHGTGSIDASAEAPPHFHGTTAHHLTSTDLRTLTGGAHTSSAGSRSHVPPSLHQPDYRVTGSLRSPNSAGMGAAVNGAGQAPVPVPVIIPAVPNIRFGNGQVRIPGPNPSRDNGGAETGVLLPSAARSPPGSRSTAHVPCRFYRLGTCQAGKTCQFLHSDAPLNETPICKYFVRGNCRYGSKCALAHVSPDGRRMNKSGVALGGPNFHRLNVQTNSERGVPSSLLTMQARMAPFTPPVLAYPPPDDGINSQPIRLRSSYDSIPTIDTSFTSNPSSAYGSPPNHARLLNSPLQKGLTLKDAALPASFDSQGISLIARYGPIASSMPSRVGHESPPSSLLVRAGVRQSPLRNLGDFHGGGDLIGNRLDALAVSPSRLHDDLISRRFLYSERQPKSNILSASVGTNALPGEGDWENNFAFEEELAPRNFQDFLTPWERGRRVTSHGFGATGGIAAGGSGEDLLAPRQALSGLMTSHEPTSKGGSPSTASPSRFAGTLFPRASLKPNGATDGPSPIAGATSASSPFGHVGSPLRSSSARQLPSPVLRAIGKAENIDGLPSSTSTSPRQGGTSMSIISQQLRTVRLGSDELPARVDQYESPADVTLSGLGDTTAILGAKSSVNGKLNRTLSGGSSGREKAEEEQGVFSMEEEEQK